MLLYRWLNITQLAKQIFFCRLQQQTRIDLDGHGLILFFQDIADTLVGCSECHGRIVMQKLAHRQHPLMQIGE